MSARDKEMCKSWAASGSWPGEIQLTIGAALLKGQPRALQDLGCLQSRDEFAVWHAWGSPAPHHCKPQWFLFDVVEAVRFQIGLDHRPFVQQLRLAEQRSSWTVHLSKDGAATLENMLTLDGRTCAEVFLAWGVEIMPEYHTVFTTLGPLVQLVASGYWGVLADVARTTIAITRRFMGPRRAWV